MKKVDYLLLGIAFALMFLMALLVALRTMSIGMLAMAAVLVVIAGFMFSSYERYW